MNECITKKKSYLFYDFMWLCAGVNRDILLEYPTEWIKYTAIGAQILFTSLITILSGVYVLFTMINNQTLASIGGLLFGLLSFNLIRYLLNTFYVSSGKKTLLEKTIIIFPRVIIAVYLSITIATPLQVMLFEDRIDKQIHYNKLIKRQSNISNESLYNQLFSNDYQNKVNEKVKTSDDELATNNKIDFIARYEVLTIIKESDNSITIVTIFITLFIIFNIAGPIILKLVVDNDPYEIALDYERNKASEKQN